MFVLSKTCRWREKNMQQLKCVTLAASWPSTAPRLDFSKTLKQQYNFTIKPFLLHLRYV
jgi:hypothetical protein